MGRWGNSRYELQTSHCFPSGKRTWWRCKPKYRENRWDNLLMNWSWPTPEKHEILRKTGKLMWMGNQLVRISGYCELLNSVTHYVSREYWLWGEQKAYSIIHHWCTDTRSAPLARSSGYARAYVLHFCLTKCSDTGGAQSRSLSRGEDGFWLFQHPFRRGNWTRERDVSHMQSI